MGRAAHGRGAAAGGSSGAAVEMGAKPVRSRWERAVLVCRKCQKRTGKVFGPDGDEPLARALRRALPDAGRDRKARVGVVEVGCLKLCPQRGVVVVDTAAPGCWHVVGPGEALPTALGE